MKAIFTILMLAGWLLALHALWVWGNPEVSAWVGSGSGTEFMLGVLLEIIALVMLKAPRAT